MGKTALGRTEKIAIWMGIIGNAVLFGGKIVIGLAFNSIAIISDSLNSFTDIIASAIKAKKNQRVLTSMTGMQPMKCRKQTSKNLLARLIKR